MVQPYITVITHISSDVSQPSLYLTAKNGQKYLIGRAGEGLQRSFTEKKIRTSKLSGIFLTGTHSWPTLSGVPGFLLSIADRELNLSRLYTSRGSPFHRINNLIDSWRCFNFHSPLKIEACADTYSDENLTIEPLNILESTSYSVEMKAGRGRFLVERARELGVPPGALFGKLSNGESVQVPGSDQVVTPEEVMGPAAVPSRALVLDLPTMQHIEAASSKLAVLGRQGESELRAIYYFFDREVDLNAEPVKSLIAGLNAASTSTVRHFVSHPTTSPNYNTLHSLGEFQTVFLGEFPQHFSCLTSEAPQCDLPRELVEEHNCRIVEQLHTFSLVARELGDPSKKRAKTTPVEMDPPASETAHRQIKNAPLVVPCSQLKEPEIITLGTGASAPSKYRNVSGTLVRAPHWGQGVGGASVLFDCGEATYNFMNRLFGKKGTLSVLKELQLLYISHMHADHHLGSQQLIRAWINANRDANRQLVIACPGQFIEFITMWASIDHFEEDLTRYVRFIDLETVCIGRTYTGDTEHIAHEEIQKLAQQIGLRITACTALHCRFSYNTSVRSLDNKFKVSYSGDTRPNKFFAKEIGQNSDLLIHEATHESELAEMAAKKGHSTINEALQIAEQMMARNTVLTHISQRYPKLPSLELGEDEQIHACFGFDGMRASLSEIPDLQKLVPKMGELLAELETTTSDEEECT